MLSAHVPGVNSMINDIPRMQSALLQHTSGQSCCIQANHSAQAVGMLVSEACMQITVPSCLSNSQGEIAKVKRSPGQSPDD